MSNDDFYASEICGRALCEYAAVMQVNIGAEDMIKEIRSATGIPFSDNMQRFVTLDRDFSSAETAEIMKEIRELLEVKKLVKEVGSASGTFGGRGGGGASGKDIYGNDLPICKRFGKACFSYQKGIKCSHVAPKQNNGGKGKRKWGSKWT